MKATKNKTEGCPDVSHVSEIVEHCPICKSTKIGKDKPDRGICINCGSNFDFAAESLEVI